MGGEHIKKGEHGQSVPYISRFIPRITSHTQLSESGKLTLLYLLEQTSLRNAVVRHVQLLNAGTHLRIFHRSHQFHHSRVPNPVARQIQFPQFTETTVKAQLQELSAPSITNRIAGNA